jgi:hypothetical protein
MLHRSGSAGAYRATCHPALELVIHRMRMTIERGMLTDRDPARPRKDGHDDDRAWDLFAADAAWHGHILGLGVEVGQRT